MKRVPLLPLFAVLVLHAPDANATVRHVPLDFGTITAALAASAANDTVLVAAGSYSPSGNGETYPLVINVSGLRLLGAGADVTVLDAQGTGGVLFHVTAGGGRISGFRITGGRASFGGGVRIENGTVELDHNVLIGNGASSSGGGLYVNNAAAPWIHHNLILDSYSIGASDVHGASFGGSSQGVFEHNVIAHTDGNGLLTTNLAAPSVRHNIFYQNGVPSPPRGRGICWLSNAPPLIFHNLFHANQVAAVLWFDGGGDLSGAAANAVSPTDQVYGNLDPDPLFVDPAADDFHLQSGSPAIDVGDPTLPHDADGTVADLGAFPYQPVLSVAPRSGPPIALSGVPNPARAGADLRFTLAVAAAVRIEVVDASGRVVRALDGGSLPAGHHVVRWDGRDATGRAVRPGVFFVRLLAGASAGRFSLVVIR